MSSISLCIATYRRADRLDALLQDLAQQCRLPDEIVVVDNDPEASARNIVERHSQAPAPFAIRYAIQPQKNISMTRNKSVELASGEWLGFIDDDERAPPDWLERLFKAAMQYSADGILGPVVPIVPPTAPAWIRRGRFYDFPRLPSGTLIPPNRFRFGNVLLRGALLRGSGPPFDPAYGLTGGEDGDLLARAALNGARIVWCDEAIVNEPIEPRRLSLRWLLRRALSGGQDLARHAMGGRYGRLSRGRRLLFFARAAVQACVAAALVPLCLPIGRHWSAFWMTKVSANIGKLSVLWGGRLREYA
jgi:succinoglycan biosynthesis protein ExoM